MRGCRWTGRLADWDSAGVCLANGAGVLRARMLLTGVPKGDGIPLSIGGRGRVALRGWR